MIGFDYHGLKPTMEVAVGDKVKLGQVVFTDKKTPGVKYTSPASGTVTAVNRGAKRVFQSLVVEIEDGEQETFAAHTREQISSLAREQVVQQLIDSGEWTAIRNRPFNRVPSPDTSPRDLFITAIDTRPLAADPAVIIGEQTEAFEAGIDVLAHLTEGRVFLCKAPGAAIPQGTDKKVQTEEFSGPHPAGLVGTHIHFLSPVGGNKSVWHVGYQDVIAIGHLFLTGTIYTERVIALAGPGVEKPRLLRTRRGVDLEQLTAGELRSATQRIISGSVLDGAGAAGPTAYLGRYANQVSALEEGTKREFMGYLTLGTGKFTLTRLYAAAFGAKNLNFTTSTGGSERAMVPMGTFEEVMPLDILPTQLLRALLVSDVEASIQLGCLELDEEDLALCTFACPGKYEYGPYLREMLTQIEAEG
ncbi:MAG: Na(+)-translocating NADH-quinone reductase subunit A [Pseudomonadales bacterium]|nr:Na(+)-translocating NADH-quinone reductase subunit A [Pseudomonadales bacterium]